MIEIIPAILTKDPEELKEKIKSLEGLAQRVQIDVIDGIFANNKTVGLVELERLETSLLLDLHLMVKEPINWVEQSIRAGADRIIAQIEMMSSQGEFVEKVRTTGIKVGLALDLYTGLGAIEKDVLADLDVVLVMAVKSGFGGQNFQGQALKKVNELLSYKVNNGMKYKLCVDGGENEEHIKTTQESGADEVVIGSSLFKGNIEENIQNLGEAIRDRK